MNKIRVLIAEDHKVVREGLKLIIETEADMQVIGEADNGHKAIRLAQELKPDVLLMDISMPRLNGLVATTKLKKTDPDVKILTLTRHTDKAYLQELLQAGVSGYVLKQSDSIEMLRAIRAVANGENYLDPAVTFDVLSIVSEKQSKPRGEVRGDPLSERESEVLRLVARGFSNKEIAGQLDISVKTVETFRANALLKLGISGRNEIVNYAILQGWFEET